MQQYNIDGKSLLIISHSVISVSILINGVCGSSDCSLDIYTTDKKQTLHPLFGNEMEWLMAKGRIFYFFV